MFRLIMFDIKKTTLMLMNEERDRKRTHIYIERLEEEKVYVSERIVLFVSHIMLCYVM